MRFSFRHALAERSVGDSVLVRAMDEEGRVGWGESAPRPYVTGEDPEAALELLERELIPEYAGSTFDSLDELAAALRDRGERLQRDQHAAFCALELALLDLGGIAFDRSAGDLLGEVVEPVVYYSGIVSEGNSDEITRTCTTLREIGVRAVKVKVGSHLDQDLRALSIVREQLGDEVSLRIDANCAWDAETALQRLRTFEAFRLDGVEQPCASDDVAANARVTAETGANTIADESLVSLADARELAEREAFRTFNVRVSKCGGLLLSARVRDLAREAGIGLMVGAQVGETAVLSAAGRHLAVRTPDLAFAEGSYGKLLLQQDLSDTTALGPGGEGRAIEGPGLGLSPRADRLDPYLDRPWPVLKTR
jgi:muconate cycloisomerase